MCDVLNMPSTSQVCPLNGVEVQLLNSSVGQAFSLSVVKMSALGLPGKYQGDSAAISFVLTGSLTTRLSPLQGHEISAEGMMFQ
jgi:hypothetical protein